jgi:hypothetical protein
MAQTATAAPSARPLRYETAGASKPSWWLLFRVGGIGALLTAVLIPLQIAAFLIWPLPDGGVLDWFELFQNSPIVALISYDLVILLEEVLLIPILIALFVLLRRTSPSIAAMATGMWFVSVALFIASNTAFDMLALSSAYAEAATEAERAAYIAAGQAALTNYMDFGTAFVVGYVLASVAGIMVGVAMLRSAVFPAVAGWVAIVANLLGLALFVPGIGVWLSIGSVLLLIVWYAVVGWRLVRMAAAAGEEARPI